MLYPQSGDSFVTSHSVMSLHSMYNYDACCERWQVLYNGLTRSYRQAGKCPSRFIQTPTRRRLGLTRLLSVSKQSPSQIGPLGLAWVAIGLVYRPHIGSRLILNRIAYSRLGVLLQQEVTVGYRPAKQSLVYTGWWRHRICGHWSSFCGYNVA